MMVNSWIDPDQPEREKAYKINKSKEKQPRLYLSLSLSVSHRRITERSKEMSGVNRDNGKKPAAAKQRSADVNLKVKSQKRKTMYFRMKRDTPLQELIDVYSKRYDIFNFRFLFDGQGFNPKLTAIQAGMKDGDEIDAMLHVDGGGGRGKLVQ